MPTRAQTQRSRELRMSMPAMEVRLWTQLRHERLGWKFRRQWAIGPYFADFACVAARLVVEVDGLTHDGRLAYDALRTALICSRGYRVLRFSSQEVLEKLDWVVEEIRSELDRPSTPEAARPGTEITWRRLTVPSPALPGGEGERRVPSPEGRENEGSPPQPSREAGGSR
jgi:very-short-patch-repair endonuclease